jgi:integrase
MPKLTKTIIDAVPTPASGDTWVWDSELEGFGVRVQASGRKTYVLRYRTKDAARTQRKLTVCRCSDAPPDKARAMARDIIMQVVAGTDVAAERKPNRDSAITLQAMFEARIKSMRAKDRANADEVERVLLKAKHNAADYLGRTTAPGAVTPADIVKFVSVHYAAGNRGAADKARGYLAAAFAWAITSANDYTVKDGQDWGVTHNPAAAVAKDPDAKTVRDRNLDAAEIRVVWEACSDGNAGFSEGIQACIKLLISCGQRVQETLRIEGSEIDLDAMVWRMPAHKTKGRKRAHTIPLPRVVAPTLIALKDQYGDGPLFPARTGSKSDLIGIVSIGQAVRRWLDTDGNGMVAFQPRDLRRTWKSRTHDAGIDRFTRDLIQQHAQDGDTGSKHYDRADYSAQMRTAMDKWSRWLEATIEGRQPLLLVA